MKEKEYAQATELDNTTVSYSHKANNPDLIQTSLGEILNRIREDKYPTLLRGVGLLNHLSTHRGMQIILQITRNRLYK